MIEFVHKPEKDRWWYFDFDFRPHGYYFWNEKKDACCGPYETETNCKFAYNLYTDWVKRLAK